MSPFARFFASPYVLLTLTILFWAGNTTIARGFRDSLPPAGLSFWRWAIALMVLLPIGGRAAWAGRRAIQGDWPRFVLLAFLSVSTYNTVLYYAVQYTTAINAALVAASMPVMTVACSWLMLKRGLNRLQAFGIVVSTVGVAVLVARGELGGLASLSFNPGDLLMLIAVPSWALYSVMLEKKRPALSSLGMLTAMVAIGLPFILPVYLWEIARGLHFAVTAPNLAALAYAGLFPSVLAYVFWNRGVELVGANAAGQFIYLTPVAGAALAILFLGEELHLYHGAGMVLVLAGVWLATRRR